MYRVPYDSLVTARARQNLDRINKEIKEEKQKDNVDPHKLMRLEEEKLIQDLFYGGMANNYAKYRSPW